MKILFVSSGNHKNGISTIIFNQGESLRKAGIDVSYFTIKGKGLKNYIKNIFILKRYYRENKDRVDIVHAHFSLSAIVASLAGIKPLVVSLMGSDVKANFIKKSLIYFYYYFFWHETIVKSEDLKKSLSLKKIHIIPNGVNFKLYRPFDKFKALNKTGWDTKKKHILFAANPNLAVKNVSLAIEALKHLSVSDLELHYLKNIPNEKTVYYYNAADIVLLTSLYEGSPNVIKEAMACNVPIVATDVGDVKEIIKGTEGCYVSGFDPKDVANKIKKALEFDNRTTGRKNIEHLRAEKVALKLIDLYKAILIDII